MQLAQILLSVSEGHMLLKQNITPAEAFLLDTMHRSKSGGNAVTDVQVTGEVKRSSVKERDRLSQMYAKKEINAHWPGATPTLPDTFGELGEAWKSKITEFVPVEPTPPITKPPMDADWQQPIEKLGEDSLAP